MRNGYLVVLAVGRHIDNGRTEFFNFQINMARAIDHNCPTATDKILDRFTGKVCEALSDDFVTVRFLISRLRAMNLSRSAGCSSYRLSAAPDFWGAGACG
jgi:hypothetical protein